MLEKKINITMPVFIYAAPHINGTGDTLRIEGKYYEIQDKMEFCGYIEIHEEKYNIKSIDCRDGIILDHIIILAGYMIDGMEIKKGAAVFIDSGFKCIRGTLYNFQGAEMYKSDFAAPAATMEEASAICERLKPKDSGTGIAYNEDKVCDYQPYKE